MEETLKKKRVLARLPLMPFSCTGLHLIYEMLQNAFTNDRVSKISQMKKFGINSFLFA